MGTIRLNPGSEHIYFDDSQEALTFKDANLLAQQSSSDLMWLGKDKQYGSDSIQIFTVGNRLIPSQTYEQWKASGTTLYTYSVISYDGQGYMAIQNVFPSFSSLPPDAPTYFTPIFGQNSFTLGASNLAYGVCSTAMGQLNIAGPYNFLCGYNNRSLARFGISFGQSNVIGTNGQYSLLVGDNNYSNAAYCLLAGYFNRCTNNASAGTFVSGQNNTFGGKRGLISGYYNVINNNRDDCMVTGNHNIAGSSNQMVQGKYNIADTNSTYAHIVGNGTSSARSNAYTLDWSGNAWFAGDVTNGNGDKLSSLSDYQYEVLLNEDSDPIIHFERIGRVCKATIDFKPITLAAYSQTVVATIPEGYWPAVPNRIVLGAINAHDLWMNVSSENGEVQIGSNATAVTNESVWGTVVWIVPPSSE